jgi:hypothetical protein
MIYGIYIARDLDEMAKPVWVYRHIVADERKHPRKERPHIY